jgi:predicted transcriptional regulator
MNDYYYDDMEEMAGNEPIMLEELAERVSHLVKNMDTGMAELLECLTAIEQIALQGEDDDIIYGSFIAQLTPQVLEVITPLLGEQTRSIASAE